MYRKKKKTAKRETGFHCKASRAVQQPGRKKRTWFSDGKSKGWCTTGKIRLEPGKGGLSWVLEKSVETARSWRHSNGRNSSYRLIKSSSRQGRGPGGKKHAKQPNIGGQVWGRGKGGTRHGFFRGKRRGKGEKTGSQGLWQRGERRDAKRHMKCHARISQKKGKIGNTAAYVNGGAWWKKRRSLNQKDREKTVITRGKDQTLHIANKRGLVNKISVD